LLPGACAGRPFGVGRLPAAQQLSLAAIRLLSAAQKPSLWPTLLRTFHPLFVGIFAVGVAFAVWWRHRPADSGLPPSPRLAAQIEWNRSESPRRPVVALRTAATLPAPAIATPGNEVRQRLAAMGVLSNGEFAAVRDLLVKAARLEGTERDDLVREIGARIAPQNSAWARELVAALADSRSQHTFTRAIVESLVTANPQSAADWAADLPETALRGLAFNVLAMKWAEKDLDAARAWAVALPDQIARASAVEGLTWTWAQQDARAVYEWALGLPDATLREQVFVKTAKLLALQNPRQALEWTLQFPDGAQRENALQYVLFQWAAQDLTAATTWAAEVTDPVLRTNSEIAIARSWSTQEAQGATIWAATITDPVAQAAALKTTLRHWAEANPADAAAWMVQRGATPLNEEIFRSVTMTLAEKNSAAISAWLQGVTNPDWRRIGEQIVTAAQAQARAKPRPAG